MRGTYLRFFKVKKPTGADLYILTFRIEKDGKFRSIKLYTQKHFGNYPKWAKVMLAGIGTEIEGLIEYDDGLVDGDSSIRILEKEKAA